MMGDSIDKTEHIQVYNSAEDTTLHQHDFLEIVYFKSGIGEHYIDGKTYTISNGSLCLINAGIEHYYHITQHNPKKEIEVKNIIFQPEFFDKEYNPQNYINEIYADIMGKELNEKINFVHLSYDSNKDFATLFNIIENELIAKEDKYLHITKHCVYSILLKIFRNLNMQKNKSPMLLKNIETLEDALNYIDQHYNENITLNELSKKHHYSNVYFNSFFKNYTGLTFKKYLQKLRCDKAKQLLKDTDKTVTTICNEVGYYDPKQFFVIFKRFVGLTPAAYRKKHRQQKLQPHDEQPE